VPCVSPLLSGAERAGKEQERLDTKYCSLLLVGGREGGREGGYEI
jgi:hypothetical protein